MDGGARTKENGLLKCFRRKLVFRKTSEWVYPDRVLCKEKVFEKSFAGSKKRKKNVFKNFGDCTEQTSWRTVRPHYPYYGTGLGLKFTEARRGAITLEGSTLGGFPPTPGCAHE